MSLIEKLFARDIARATTRLDLCAVPVLEAEKEVWNAERDRCREANGGERRLYTDIENWRRGEGCRIAADQHVCRHRVAAANAKAGFRRF